MRRALPGHPKNRSLILVGSSGIKIQIETKLRKSLQRKSKQDTVLFDAAIIADDRAQRCDPAAEIAVNRVALLLQNMEGRFVLLLNAEAPIIVEAIITIDYK